MNKKNSENWVDIENEYYRELKTIVKLSTLTIAEKKQQTIILNKEFEQVKNLLERYLKEKIDEQYDFTLCRNSLINDILLPELANRFDEKEFLKEFQYCDQLYVKEFLGKLNENYNLITHFLSFNYTQVVYEYFVRFPYPKQINYIHGKLNAPINKVNFGFGDEMDDDYKLIENIDDNEYLRNFKSFQYLQNSNYKSLLDFVESDQKFQVYIMGHSCGLSDRTMLNTIFEHPNCISIKVFYHQKEDGTDNYTEIIQNISRHFNKKKLMREKIVNKTLCEPLPQIQLPLK
ncbi:AbiH family protein [Flavobacterium sp. WC2509]|uniref:AbiH family protein n=1 Tax=Flavobacterium sp. WC2509 TaxID=3461406 RepID=UPI004043E326